MRGSSEQPGSSDNHLEEVLKGQIQQAEVLQHMWIQQTQMQQALQQQVAETQSEETRGNMDGSTTEGRRLRGNLWVWLHLQDEEATESVPRQVQSWLTGKKTQQRKAFKKKPTTPSITDRSDRDLFSSTRHTARCQTGTSPSDSDESGPD